MIKNDKFVVPEDTKLKAQEKPYQYSLSFDNDWNLPCFTSSKVSKYYHDINKKFEESPNSPTNQSILERQQAEKLRAIKLNQQKTSAKSRLHARRCERTELEEYCRNSLGSPLPRISHIKVASQLSYTICDAAQEYHKYERLPKTAHKMVYTDKIASIEANSINNIIQKTQELNKLEEYKKEKVRAESLKQRQKLAEVHKKIEEKSGVRKLRVVDDFKQYCVNTFGFQKKYKVGEIFERLSQPRVTEMFAYNKSDLRGVVNTSPKMELETDNSVSSSPFWITDVKFRRNSA